MVEAKIVDGRRRDCGWSTRRLLMVDVEIVDMLRETRNLFLTSRVGCLFALGLSEGLMLLAGCRDPFKGMFLKS